MNAGIRILLFTLAFRASAGAADSPAITKEVMQTRAFVESSGENQGLSRVEVLHEPGSVQITEERSPAEGEKQRFEVTFDPATLQPTSWTRQIGEGENVARTVVQIADGNIKARTLVGDTVKKVSTLRVPSGSWCMAPLIKFHAGLCVASNKSMGIVQSVNVTDDGALKVAEVKIVDMGSTNVTVPAGEFHCRHLKLIPQSALMSALVPPGDMYISEDGTHPMVKTVISATRLGPVINTVLETYTTEAGATPP